LKSAIGKSLGRTFNQVGIAYVLTATIAWDREQEAHSTGLRTFPLVDMASCRYLLVLGSQPAAAAQSRVMQGLIGGIRFVGGGAIPKEGATVNGTATAASIWNAGVIGAAVAMGQHEIAIVLAALTLSTLRAIQVVIFNTVAGERVEVGRRGWRRPAWQAIGFPACAAQGRRTQY
jgi:putative Mg2+ transporter-C (MgtC) family protein